MSSPWAASWRRGQLRVTVTADGDRKWVYDVPAAGDRPSPGWLAGTPWAVYPGAQWQEEDGSGEPSCWTVPVFPVSAAAAQELGIPWPPG